MVITLFQTKKNSNELVHTISTDWTSNSSRARAIKCTVTGNSTIAIIQTRVRFTQARRWNGQEKVLTIQINDEWAVQKRSPFVTSRNKVLVDQSKFLVPMVLGITASFKSTRNSEVHDCRSDDNLRTLKNLPIKSHSCGLLNQLVWNSVTWSWVHSWGVRRWLSVTKPVIVSYAELTQ